LKKPVKTKYISSICSDIPMSTDQNKKKADLEYALDRYRKEYEKDLTNNINNITLNT